MDEGYTALDDAAISVKSDQKVFLFRFPKDFNIDELNGKTINLSGTGANDVDIQCSNKRKYVMRKDSSAVHSILRPVVRNNLDGSSGIGPAFSGSFNISEKVDIKSLIASAEMPIRPAYVPVEQVDFLRVRSVPIGSTSTVDAYTGEIVPGKEVYTPAASYTSVVSPQKVSKPSSKRKDAVDIVEATHIEETDGGKEKKHKKEKKSKKDKQ